MKRYKITSSTLALVPLNRFKTVVYENHDYFIIDNKVNSVISENCEYYGSSFNGRLKGTYALVGYSYKAPIVVAENSSMIFFPTSSPRVRDCSWINLANIDSISDINKATKIKFSNGEEITIDTSYNIIKNQYYKSLSLDNALKNRKNNK